jgi:uncharacterized phage infection (PIP) family protein YhgE
MPIDRLLTEIRGKFLLLQNAANKDYSETYIESLSREIENSIAQLENLIPNSIEDSLKIVRFLLSLINNIFDDIELAKRFANTAIKTLDNIENVL